MPEGHGETGPKITLGDPPEIPGINITVGNEDWHTGYSRLASYIQCPKQYYYTYVQKVEYKSGAAAKNGTAYHNFVETILRYKMEHDGDMLPWSIAEQVAQRECEELKLAPSNAKKTLQACKFYFDRAYNFHEPIAVEETFEINRGGVKLTGRIDLIETDGKIIDHKFSYDIWDEARAKSGVQPMIYQWAGLDWVEPKYGVEYSGFAYNIIRVWPTEVIQTIDIPKVGQYESEWWEDQVATIARAIQAGNFYATPSEKTCKWCSHSKVCQPAKYQAWISQTDGMISAVQK